MQPAKTGPKITLQPTTVGAQIVGIAGNCLAQAKTAAMPLWAAAVVAQYAIAKESIGWVSSGEYAAVVVGVALCATLVGRLSPRTWALVGAGVALAGNGLSLAAHDWQTLLAARAVAGVGEGVLYAVSHAIGAQMRNADRGFATMQVAACLFAIVFTTAGAALAAHFAGAGVFGLLAACCLAGMALFAAIPSDMPRLTRPQTADAAPALNLGFIALALAPLFLIAIGSQGIWPFAVLAGARTGLTGVEVGHILAMSLFLGAAGNFLAWLLAGRVSPYVPMVLGTGLLAASAILFMLATTKLVFAAGLVAGPIGFGLLVPYIYGLMARADRSGRTAGLGPLASMTGGIVSPLFVAQAFTDQGPAVFLVVAITALAIVLPVAAWLDRVGRRQTSLLAS